MADKNIGRLREEDRYHGDPLYDPRARARRTIDKSFTPQSKYMEESVTDTAETLRRSGQKMIDAKARDAMDTVRKRAMAGVSKSKK